MKKKKQEFNIPLSIEDIPEIERPKDRPQKKEQKKASGRKSAHKKPGKKKKQIILIIIFVLVLLALVAAVLFIHPMLGGFNFKNPFVKVEAEPEAVEFIGEPVDDGPPQEWLDKLAKEQEELEKKRAEEEANRETTVLFAGDVLFDYGMPGRYAANGINGVVSPDVLSAMTGADLCIVNQEFPFGTGGEKADKQYTFIADPTNVSAMLELGVDAVTIANNHTLDYGRDVLRQNCEILEGAGIKYTGGGENLDRAKQLQLFEINGKKIGFLAASRVIPSGDWNASSTRSGLFTTYDSTQLCEEIKKAKEVCDVVFVYVHWGIEKDEYPQEYEYVLAKSYAAAGADAVIGSHPHVLQGIENVDGIPVFYSLGNFIFNVSIERTMMVKATIAGDGSISWQIIPCYAANGVTSLAEADKKSNILTYLESISYDAVLDDEGNVSWSTGTAEQ